MSDCGTCLNIDHRAEVRVVVRADTVELHCHGTEIALDAASLDRLIECGERAKPGVGRHSDRIFGDRAVSTWMECDSGTPLDWSIISGALEMHWGRNVMTVTGAALAPLIERAWLARTELDQRLAAPCDDDLPDLIIPVVPVPARVRRQSMISERSCGVRDTAATNSRACCAATVGRTYVMWFVNWRSGPTRSTPT